MGRVVDEQGFEQGVLLLKKAIHPYLKRETFPKDLR
jgi:hypothetical protein